MTEVERFLLCRRLPRLSCGSYVNSSRDLVQACFADAEALLSMSTELRQAYESVQQRYTTLPSEVRAVADRMLSWVLQLRLQYGDECADTILALYPLINKQIQRKGFLYQPN